MNGWRASWLALAGILSSGFADVVINEIHYDPPVKTERSEFIELYNRGPAPVALDGWRISGGVAFAFPAGAVIPAGGYVVIAEDPPALRARFGVAALGPWTGLLSNEGETITLRDASGAKADEVTYQLGFPWPTVGDPPGYSIELVNPAFDNDLGGNWRRSVRGAPPGSSTVLIPENSLWKYRKGTSEPSAPVTAWREASFDDSAWPAGAAPIGYDPAVRMGTVLNDMPDRYTSVYFRRKFQVADPARVGALVLRALYDDGLQVWINGVRVVNAGLPNREVRFDEVATGTARESADYDAFVIQAPSFLRAGENVIAAQLHNILLSGSSDCFFDLALTAQAAGSASGPTPGARNAAFDTNLPPVLRQVKHTPEQPGSGEPVVITVKATDADGVASVELHYQQVDPGNYIDLLDPAYETAWASLPMTDDGTGGDAQAGDAVYTAVLPPALQVHRRLVRYRITAADAGGRTVRIPYEDDPQPNFAFFVYDGIPAWNGAIEPGSSDPGRAQIQQFAAGEMGRLPAYHLISKRTAVEDATWRSKYGGDQYRWRGTLVYDGRVYDHIRYRARGGVWRYAMGKNMWKFDLNRGHEFRARDNYGRRYQTTWKKINLGANIQQAQFLHRGEQGMFESVGFALFNLAGVEAPKTHWVTFRVIDEPDEAPAGNQHGGDFWGLYLAVEQEDGRFLDEHGLPDGNLYKMEGGTGELNNQGRTSATDKSDLNLFISTYRNSENPPSEAWWRANFDVDKYYSYHTIVHAIHHYDICDGKNYFYFLNPQSGKWSVHTWDLDLTWADNMYRNCDGDDPFRTRVAQRPPFDLEFQNRAREIRDLLFNTDQAWKLIDEYAGIVRGAGTGPDILAADRAMWDYHPVMIDPDIVLLQQAGHGRFYLFPLESASNPARQGNFQAAVDIMKDYVVRRAAFLDARAADPAIPARPSVSYLGPPGFPLNRIQLRSAAYAGTAPFAAMKWRVGEVRSAGPGAPGIYEIQPVWESSESPVFAETIAVPPEVLKSGHAYRARVRMKDTTGRWSQWSAPLEFVAGEPDNAAALQTYLRLSELMYHPPSGPDREYLELYNSSANITLDLGGAAFTDGIDFRFPFGSLLGPGEYLLLANTTPELFRGFYQLGAQGRVLGPYSGNLNNDGERLTLRTGPAGAVIFSFVFNDAGGWPAAADGSGHSLVLREEALRRTDAPLDFPGHWRGSAYRGGSPGRADPEPGPGLVINEFAASTDFRDPLKPEYDSNDWIELYNNGGPVSLGDYYLSDDAARLDKWRLPDRVLGPGERISFDQVTGFGFPPGTGFALSSSGETVYLSRLTGGPDDRVADAIRFKGQESGSSFGRYPDGSPFLYTLRPTRDLPNEPAPPSLVLTEWMYQPPADASGAEDVSLEFIEIYNASSSPIALWNTHGSYRLDGGAAFAFPTNGPASFLAPGAVLLLVSFDPADSAALARFTGHYQISVEGRLFAGPFTGRLGNHSDRLAIEKPRPPESPGAAPAWIVVDQCIYTRESGAAGSRDSLHRLRVDRSASHPANVVPARPTPGLAAPPAALDSDGDTLPDEWELAHGLDPRNPDDAREDGDRDGADNLSEFIAGTDPRDPSDKLELQVVTGPDLRLQFRARPGRIYTLEVRERLDGSGWRVLQEIFESSGSVLVPAGPVSGQERYFRLKVRP